MATKKTLNDIPGDLALEAQQAGLMRLHLYFIGQTHARLIDLAAEFRSILVKYAGEDGKLDGLGNLLAQRDMLAAWKAFYEGWARLFETARWQAGSLAFGGMAVMHRRVSEATGERISELRITNGEWADERICESAEEQIQNLKSKIQNESLAGERIQNPKSKIQNEDQTGEPELDAVYRPQLQAVLDAANRRLYGDGLVLSQRLWKHNQQSWSGIQATLAQGIADGNSAWKVAKELERFLGAGAECPRWTSTRLYKRTKSDIAAGDMTGLYSGAACAGQGVAYNALRLARNEFQIAHHMATDSMFGKMPWVEKEAINLSPSHPSINCACEDVVVSGENGTNVYKKGEVSLPIHVQCLCYKTAVLMDDDVFVDRLRGWLDGTQPWGAMDDFSSWLGVMPMDAFSVSLAVGIANNLAVWLWGDEDDLDALMQDQPTQQLPLPEV